MISVRLQACSMNKPDRLNFAKLVTETSAQEFLEALDRASAEELDLKFNGRHLVRCCRALAGF
jgi:hypothetical protein